MTYGGLFEGIGGFALAAQWAGFTPVWSNEIDPFCCNVLRKNFNHEIIEADIRECGKGRKHELKPVDIICGGFPCQPFSTAGKRQGEKDNRYLWPEMLRVIGEIRPRFVVAENVPGILSLQRGMVFEQVCADLENEGYEVQPLIIPACAVNAPHRRDRIWFVAYADDNGKGANTSTKRNYLEREKSKNKEQKRGGWSGKINGFGNEQFATNTYSNDAGGCKHGKIRQKEGKTKVEEKERERVWGDAKRNNKENFWSGFPTQSPVCNGDDGIPSGLVRGYRSKAIQAGGNAIVPQIAFEIFKAIKAVTNS